MTDFFTEDHCDIHHTTKVITIEKANALLRERSTAVYGHYDGKTFWANDPKLGLRSGMTTPDTHTALLINITPLEVDSAERIVAEMLSNHDSYNRNFDGKKMQDKFNELIDRARKLTKGE